MIGKSARVAWLIFFGSYFIYQANLRPIASDDSLPAALMPFSILTEHTLRLDRFEPFLQGSASVVPYYLREKDRHFYSNYPVAGPILLTPLYLPVCLLVHPARWPPGDFILLARIVEKILAGAIAAASAALFFVLLDRLTSRANAILLTAAYAFGASVWTISSQALWQHTAGGLLLVLALLALERWSGDRRRLRPLLAAGIYAGLALAVRPTNLFLAIAAALALAIHGARFRALAAFLTPVALAGALTASWNLWLFEDLRANSAVALSPRLLDGLAGLLLSPSHGLLIYTPFVIFGVAGVAVWWRTGHNRGSLLLTTSVAFCAASLALVSGWPMWWGGHCWGPRLLTETIPFLILLILPAMDGIASSRPWRALFLCLVLYSVFVQFVGAFFYPKGLWEEKPVNVDFHPGRLWDWADNPVRRSLDAGFAGEPYAVLLEGAAHGPAAAIHKIKYAGYKGF